MQVVHAGVIIAVRTLVDTIERRDIARQLTSLADQVSIGDIEI